MAQKTPQQSNNIDAITRNPMMAHLTQALKDGKDIGHYGRLVFAMVARHFLDERTLVDWLTKDKDFDEPQARALVLQVEEHEYNPPGPGKIRQWQSEQDFPILPPDHPGDDDANVYQDLDFPPHVYDRITEYYEEKAEAKLGA